MYQKRKYQNKIYIECKYIIHTLYVYESKHLVLRYTSMSILETFENYLQIDTQ